MLFSFRFFLYISNYTKLPTVASVAADDVLLDVAVGERERVNSNKTIHRRVFCVLKVVCVQYDNVCVYFYEQLHGM
jgi:hypothetical protein